MKSQLIIDIMLLRHGRTDYTEKGLDLTALGEAHSREVAEKSILPWLERLQVRREDLSIITSPAARAKGTGTLISQVVGNDLGIVVCDILKPMAWRDPIRARTILGEMKKRGGYIDYETEACFADAFIFETYSEVKERWYIFFAQYVTSITHRTEMCRATVLVAHYELLCNITRDLFGVVSSETSALQHTEPIYLSLYQTDDPNLILIEGKVRDMANSRLFDMTARQFA